MAGLKTGDKFGDYSVVRQLGAGGMGSVWLLEGTDGGAIAAKILNEEISSDHEARKRFLREAQLALEVKHPNLVGTYDVGQDPDTGLCYILMEYVPGGTLADVLADIGRLPVNDAVAVVRAIASVLEAARQTGVVHRDIKPANIMFGRDGTPKLSDLGIARGERAGSETTVTQQGLMIGTPAYMAPEQMVDSHRVDTRADIYSLGIVFYEMLTGERPNKDDSVVQLMARALAGEPIPDVRVLRPEVSADYARLLAAMVEPDRDRRISTPGHVLYALDAIRSGASFDTAAVTTIRRTAPLPPAKPKRFLSREIVLPAAFVIVLAALFAALAVQRLVRSPRERFTSRESDIRSVAGAESARGAALRLEMDLVLPQGVTNARIVLVQESSKGCLQVSADGCSRYRKGFDLSDPSAQLPGAVTLSLTNAADSCANVPEADEDPPSDFQVD